MLHFSPSTWVSSKPPTLQLFHGLKFNSPIYQTVLRGQLRQEPTLLISTYDGVGPEPYLFHGSAGGYQRAALDFRYPLYVRTPRQLFSIR